MKSGVFAVLVVFVLSLNFCLATEVKIYNDSLVNTNYTTGSVISGILNFSLTNVPANAIITSNLGGNISLRDFLKANSKPLSCENFNCSDVYATSSTGATSKGFNYPSQSLFGFKIDSGKNVQVTNLSFNLDSDFPASNEIPLSLDFFDNKNWTFEEPSGDFSRFQSYGCFDANASKVGDSVLGSVRYCEQITNLPSSKTYMVGADFSGVGTKKITMSLRAKNDTSGEDCTFDASLTNNCTINLDESFPKADYFVCITAEDIGSDYIISRESSGSNCGFSDSITNLGKSDFPIFVKVPLYASSFTLNRVSPPLNNFVFYANQYLMDIYNKDCSSGGCVFPVKISGVDQNVQISSINVRYKSDEAGLTSTNKVYSLTNAPFLVSFNNSILVDLSNLGFELNSSGTKKLVISIDGVKILEKTIGILLAPTIGVLTPLNPPAGIPTTFTLTVSSTSNITGYDWNFGDGSKISTSTNSVSHTYLNKSIYNMQVSVKDSTGVSAQKNFTIFSGSPADIINLTIDSKNIKLKNLLNSLSVYPTWESDYIQSILKLEDYKNQLKVLDDKRINTFTDAGYINIALALTNLTIPERVFVSNEIQLPFLVNPSDIDPTPLRKISGGVGETDVSGYKEGISQWERENIQGITDVKRFEVLGDNGQNVFLMNLFSVDVKSTSGDESYFVFNKKGDILKSDGTVQFQDADEFSYLTIPAGAEKTFEFANSMSENSNFYVSPVLSKLPYNNITISPCNFNLVCESNLGENYNNCRFDCKPIGRTIYWTVLVIILGLFLYTILQEWYKRNYEKVLFEDRSHLFNLVSYIDNMTSRGVNEGEVRRKLGEQGWTMEKINYAFKKSKGQRVGMYELIPVEKLLSLLRQNESKKQVRASPMVFPTTPRMIMPQNTNLNKAKNPNPNIKRW